MSRTCTDCAAPITVKSRTGWCRPCSAKHLNSDPAIHARRVAGIHRKFAEDPQFKAEQAARLLVNASTPAAALARVATGKRIAREVLARPDVKALTHSPEARAKRGRTMVNTKLAWCPEEWRDSYRRMLSGGTLAKDAKAMILDTVRVEARREVAARQRAMTEKHARDLASRY